MDCAGREPGPPGADDGFHVAAPHPYAGYGNSARPQHSPAPAPGESQTAIAVRIVAGVLGGSAAVPWLLVIWMVLSSVFSTNPAQDPHGYGIVFGFLAYVPLSLACAALLPLTLPKRLWARGFGVSALLLIGITGLLMVALNYG